MSKNNGNTWLIQLRDLLKGHPLDMELLTKPKYRDNEQATILHLRLTVSAVFLFVVYFLAFVTALCVNFCTIFSYCYAMNH